MNNHIDHKKNVLLFSINIQQLRDMDFFVWPIWFISMADIVADMVWNWLICSVDLEPDVDVWFIFHFYLHNTHLVFCDVFLLDRERHHASL